jgi:hypothetical protein
MGSRVGNRVSRGIERGLSCSLEPGENRGVTGDDARSFCGRIQ